MLFTLLSEEFYMCIVRSKGSECNGRDICMINMGDHVVTQTFEGIPKTLSGCVRIISVLIVLIIVMGGCVHHNTPK